MPSNGMERYLEWHSVVASNAQGTRTAGVAL